MSPKASLELKEIKKHPILCPKPSHEINKHQVLSPKTSVSSDSSQKRPVPAPRKLRNVQPGLQKVVVIDNSKVECLEAPKFEKAEFNVDEVSSPKVPSSQQFTFCDVDESG